MIYNRNTGLHVIIRKGSIMNKIIIVTLLVLSSLSCNIAYSITVRQAQDTRYFASEAIKSNTPWANTLLLVANQYKPGSKTGELKIGYNVSQELQKIAADLEYKIKQIEEAGIQITDFHYTIKDQLSDLREKLMYARQLMQEKGAIRK